MLTMTISVTKAVAAADDYAANDVISESATVGTAWVFTLPQDVRRILKAILLVETASQAHTCVLLLFKANPSTANLRDNVANTAPVHAHEANFLGAIEFPALRGLGGDSFAVATPSTYGNLPLEIELEPSTGKIYGILVTTVAFTNETATDDYIIKLVVE